VFRLEFLRSAFKPRKAYRSHGAVD
jgi:hypothetical protein